MKIKFFTLFLLIIAILLNSCDYLLEDDEYNYSSKAQVSVRSLYTNSYGEQLYEMVPDYDVYVFNSYDAEHYGIYDTEKAYFHGVTDYMGHVVVNFTKSAISNYDYYVFVVFDRDNHATKLEVQLQLNEFADIVMFATGESPLEPVYKNINTRYNLVTLVDDKFSISSKGDRNAVNFTLPDNTVYWYYTFTCYDYYEYTYNFSLENELSYFYNDYTGVEECAINQICPPVSKSDKVTKTWLLDELNAHNFVAESEFNSIYSFNVNSLIMEEDNYLRGSYALGFESSTIFVTDIYLQVIAVVED